MNFHPQHAGGMIATGLLQGLVCYPADRPGFPEKITVGLFMACLRPSRFHPFYSSP
ncbi:hypothetical protein KZ779_12710 [Escherichia coli]|nr:hypothetical protein [Escherichia coli]